MAYEFTKLSEVQITEEPSKSATILIEDNGEIKRAAGKSIGGGGLVVTVNSSDISSGK